MGSSMANSDDDDSSSGYIAATIVLAIVSVLLLLGVFFCYIKQSQMLEASSQQKTEIELPE